MLQTSAPHEATEEQYGFDHCHRLNVNVLGPDAQSTQTTEWGLTTNAMPRIWSRTLHHAEHCIIREVRSAPYAIHDVPPTAAPFRQLSPFFRPLAAPFIVSPYPRDS